MSVLDNALLFFREIVVHFKGQVILSGCCVALTGYGACSESFCVVKLISSVSIDDSLSKYPD